MHPCARTRADVTIDRRIVPFLFFLLLVSLCSILLAIDEPRRAAQISSYRFFAFTYSRDRRYTFSYARSFRSVPTNLSFCVFLPPSYTRRYIFLRPDLSADSPSSVRVHLSSLSFSITTNVLYCFEIKDNEMPFKRGQSYGDCPM